MHLLGLYLDCGAVRLQDAAQVPAERIELYVRTVSNSRAFTNSGFWALDKFTDADKKFFATDPVAFAAFRREMEDEVRAGVT